MAADVAERRRPAAVAAGLADGDVAMVENVRFEPAETSKDAAERAELAGRLAALAQLYVGDGFGRPAPQARASVYDVAGMLLPSAAGDLVLAEVAVLRQLTAEHGAALRGRARRRQALGQARRDRQPARHRPTEVLIGGGMSYTFLTAQGHEMGRSLLEADKVGEVSPSAGAGGGAGRGDRAAARPSRRREVRAGCRAHHVFDVGAFPADYEGVDIQARSHPRAVRQAAKLADASTAVFLERQPVGVFEFPAFAAGHAGGRHGDRRAAGPDSWSAAATSAAAVRQLGIRGGRVQPHFHRGGASLGVPGGRHAAGPGSAGFRVSAARRAASRWWRATGRCTTTISRRSRLPRSSGSR